MGHRLWLPAVANYRRLGVVEIAPCHHHCFRTAHPCAQSVKNSPGPAVKDWATSSPILTQAGAAVALSFQIQSLLLLADESSGMTMRMKLFRDLNLLAAGR